MTIKDSKQEEIVFFVFFQSRPDGRWSVISIGHQATNLQKAEERCGGRTLEMNEKQKMGPEKEKESCGSTTALLERCLLISVIMSAALI